MKPFSLENSKKIDSGFKIPNRYFENFEVILPKQDAKVISFWKKNQRKFIGAAAIFMLSMTIPVLNFYTKNKQENLHNEIENYLVYNTDVTADELAEYCNSTKEKTIDFSNIPTEDIENQLIENEATNYILD